MILVLLLVASFAILISRYMVADMEKRRRKKRGFSIRKHKEDDDDD